MPLTDVEIRRVLNSIQFKNGCWEWRGADNGAGYGKTYIGKRTRYAHRIVYEIFKGPIPRGLQLDHLCRNRKCVKPSHLEAVTARENILRGEGASARNSQKTHCPYGHEYTEKNTYVYGRWRQCRACRKRRKKEWIQQQSEKR